MRRCAIALLSVVSSVSSATASPSLLVECTEPTGTSYYFEGGIVGPGQGGNRQDGMTGGRILLLQDGDKIVVATRDAVGVSRLLKPERTSTFSRLREDGGISVVVTADDLADKTVDTLLFNLNAALVGTVVWQFTKINPALTKASTFTASCRSAQ